MLSRPPLALAFSTNRLHTRSGRRDERRMEGKKVSVASYYFINHRFKIHGGFDNYIRAVDQVCPTAGNRFRFDRVKAKNGVIAVFVAE